MSRAYDAKQEALKKYPSNKEKAATFFLKFLDVSAINFNTEVHETAEDFLSREKIDASDK